MPAKGQVSTTIRGCRYVWFGGEYIDVHFGGQSEPMDCINVWNHETNQRTISTRPEFLAVCKEHRAELSEEEYREYVMAGRYC